MSVERSIGEVLLKVEGVTLSFGGVSALSDVSLDVRRGEICAIIGPNGAGKSSLLNVINGVYHPRRGSVTFRDAVESPLAGGRLIDSLIHWFIGSLVIANALIRAISQ